MTHILDQLSETLKSRKGAAPETSYVARLYQEGTGKCAQKFGEEAVETVIEAMKIAGGDESAKKTFAEESADAIFHLMVLWAQLGIEPSEIWSVLEARVGKVSDKDLK